MLRPLAWDSEVLGLPTARVDIEVASEGPMRGLEKALSASPFALLYVVARRQEGLLERGRGGLPGLFVAGENTTFGRPLGREGEGDPPAGFEVVDLGRAEATGELTQLAVLAGRTSRFRRDPRLPAAAFGRLYARWLASACAAYPGTRLLVARRPGGPPAALALAKGDGAEGLVSLISVAEDCQGRGLGAALLRACHAAFGRAGLSAARVVTQPINESACRLYRRAGYSVVDRSFVFHLWRAGRR